MKYFVIILVLFASSTYADEEFYLGDSIGFAQPTKESEAIPLPAGAARMRAGIYMEGKVGMLGKVRLRISDTSVWLDSASYNAEDTLVSEARTKFLSGEMVPLSSGNRVQFFRSSIPGDAPRLVVYSREGGILALIYLIPKKS